MSQYDEFHANRVLCVYYLAVAVVLAVLEVSVACVLMAVVG